MHRSSVAEYGGDFVYILLCADGSYYTGRSVISVEKCVSEHNLGIFDGYTKSRRPVTLVFSEHFERITDAIAFERQVKGWSRAKKEALIRRDWDELKRLSRSRKKKGVANHRGSSSAVGCVATAAPPRPRAEPHAPSPC